MRYKQQVVVAIVTGLIGLTACVVALPGRAHGAITASCASHVQITGIQKWASWNAVAVLPDGNYAVAGSFSGAADFPPALTSTSNSQDAVVAKIDAATCSAIWVRTLSGSGYAYGFGVATDAAGSIYATGQFSAPGTIGNITLTNRGLNDAWVAKWSSAGDLLAAWSLGGASSDGANAILVRDGRVYVAGWTAGPWNAGGGMIPGGTGRAGTAFVAVYTSDAGNFLDEVHWDSPKNEIAWALDMDAARNLLVGGTFGGTSDPPGATIDFNGGSAVSGGITLVSAGEADIWLANLDSTLDHALWARRFGGTSSDALGGFELDAAGNLYVAGSFRGAATGAVSETCTTGDGCLVLMSLDAAGVKRWSHSWSAASPLADVALDVAVSGDRVWMTGMLVNALDFGTGPLTPGGAYDAFAAQFDLAGNATGAVRWPSAFTDRGKALAAVGSGVVAVGQFYDSIDFGCAGCVFQRQPSTSGEGWIARLTDGVVPPTVPPIATLTPQPIATATNTEIPTVPPRTPTWTRTVVPTATLPAGCAPGTPVSCPEGSHPWQPPQ